FILAAWLYETYETIKKKKKFDTRFVALYAAGLGVLTLYSYQIGDMPFLALNSIIFSITCIELALSLKQ
ncbi:MAG: hypothetical protein QMD85_03640, partial [Candidatus Aenigmarchaeota archaeon]|nr:hypothetical protein [Candidatus Aenigmarchaeota archaeon]MDI6722648.1 hypothetical protein [Candidatus Aenigmarchaeota archaeon]